MKLLVLDGNSIVNRAFYGIKLLTTKDGRYTNAIYGFLNILLKLKDQVQPDGVAIAWDLKAPTFRHKMYDQYKAGRKGMPEELAQQMPVLKELLTAMGYKLISVEGYEADDLLGTLADCSCKQGAQCYIATGDRDSLQLVDDCVRVLLASTKMGQAQTTIYDTQAIRDEYGVTPKQLIEIKALQGDASDNIPGVAGVGKKTAGDLIQRFESIDHIYANLDTLDIKPGVQAKLAAGKESAYLSRELGIIKTDAPIDCDLNAYIPGEMDAETVRNMLVQLEIFSMLKRLGLEDGTTPTKKADKAFELPCEPVQDFDSLYQALSEKGKAYVTVYYKQNKLQALYFNTDGKILEAPVSDPAFLDFCRKLFISDIEKYTEDVKPLHAYALRNGVHLDHVKMDTGLAGYLLNPNAGEYDGLRLAAEYGAAVPQLAGEPLDASVAKLAGALPLLCENLSVKIEQNNQTELLENMELPLAEVLASMEYDGIEVDAKGIETYGGLLNDRLREITLQIYEYAGYEFNLNSPKQLGAALFEELKLPVRKKTKTGYSTNAEVLESLVEEHPVIPLILEYRTLSKLSSTYCEGLLKVVEKDGRIRSSFNQKETRTGRISSTEPNLQNIPVRTELGAELRKYFRAKEGCVLVDADYSQIELRVLSHIADDHAMIDAFNEDLDIHTITASQVFGIPEEAVTPLMRSRAKAVNFGIVYGIGAFSLAKDIGTTRAEADAYIKGYLRHYKGVDRYMGEIVAKAKEDGYVDTIFGRRRYLPELSSSNGMMRAFGERVARNMPIQGAAADIIKIAMVKTYQRLEREGLKARLILQVHDELIVEAPEEEAQTVSVLLKEEMEGACKMQVKLRADVNIGKTWYEAKG